MDKKNIINNKSAPALTICLALFAGIILILWLSWPVQKNNDPLSRTDEEFDKTQEASLILLERENTKLTELLAKLQALAGADPCAIPESINGFSLLDGSEEKIPAKKKVEEKSSSDEAYNISEKTDLPPPVQEGKANNAAEDFSASAQEIEDATALIISSSGYGTGFFVDRGIMVTNHHVTEDDPAVMVINKKLGRVRAAVLAVSGYKNNERDYAILQVNSPNLPEALPLCGYIKRADKVSAWGYPGSISFIDEVLEALKADAPTAIPEEIYSEGVVNVVYETTPLTNTPPIILHTAITSPGNSGGPLLNTDGCVVGINTLMSLDEESYRQTNIALSSRDLQEFLLAAGIRAKYKANQPQGGQGK